MGVVYYAAVSDDRGWVVATFELPKVYAFAEAFGHQRTGTVREARDAINEIDGESRTDDLYNLLGFLDRVADGWGFTLTSDDESDPPRLSDDDRAQLRERFLIDAARALLDTLDVGYTSHRSAVAELARTLALRTADERDKARAAEWK